jgi:uncharacterized membrane protein
MHSSTRWVLVELAIIIALLAVLGVARFPSLLPYLWLKTLHIFGVVIFLGNIIVTGVWMVWAERDGRRATLSFAANAVNWADVFFTAPGILLILADGLMMASRWGGVVTSWIAVGLGLFTLSGVLWVCFLVRYQDRLISLSAGNSQPEAELPDAFFRVLHNWYVWGVTATILPLVSLMVMVLKPKFW